jgi:lysozyme family protein
MERNFPKAFKLTLAHEGGWADNPKDPGGPTMKGVTLGVFRKLVKPNATKTDLRNITDEQLQIIYRHSYWDEVLGSKLPNGVDYTLYDYAVNSGPGRGVKALQKIVGVTQDGKVGPMTLKAIADFPPQELIVRLCAERLAFMKRAKSKGKLLWPTFGKGWARRVAAVEKEALLMAEAKAEAPEIVVEKKEVPVAPPQIDKPVTKTTGFWERIFTILGAGGAGFASWFTDYRVVLAIAAVIIVVAVGGLFLHNRIIIAVKDIKKAVNDAD